MRGSLPFKADARMNDVERYVSQSAATPAAKQATVRPAPQARMSLNTRNPENDPTMPIETMFAPSVLKPPWARKSACISKATAATSTLMAGPRSMAEMAVPQGCEQVPTVGTGTGMQEMMKTTAAMKPTSGLKERSSFEAALRLRSPHREKRDRDAKPEKRPWKREYPFRDMHGPGRLCASHKERAAATETSQRT